jgi:PAS domain S-box-containing protein
MFEAGRIEPGGLRPQDLQARSQRLYAEQDAQHRALTDRLFVVLAAVLWTATLALYCITFRPDRTTLAVVVSYGVGLLLLGALFVAVPVYRTVRNPGHKANPWLAALSLAICAIMFQRVSGRSDSEFAAFVVLAFLAFYRDVYALLVATVLMVADILSRVGGGPFGNGSVSARTEEIAWLLILDLVLYASITRVSAGIRKGSAQQANLEVLQEESSQAIAEREQELQESESVRTLIFESAPDGVIRSDRHLRVIEVNAIAGKMLQLSPEEAVGRNLSEFIPQIAQHLATDGPKAGSPLVGAFFEDRVRRDDGTHFFVECYASEVHGLEKPQLAIFVRDITDRKALESQLAQSQKLESIGQLAAGIAHEINTPTQYVGDNIRFLRDSFADLSNLMDAYGLLEQEAASIPGLAGPVGSVRASKEAADLEFVKAEIPKALGESLDGIDRIAVIVRALKDFSHPGVDSMTSADVNRILESTATVARNEWKYVADLELDLCPNLPPIPCLPGELGQVVLNLLVNASHSIAEKNASSAEKGRIRITTRQEGEELTILVSDTGRGIPAHVQDRVFDPFFTTKEIGKGTGQGLAIAHNVIVERHRGKLWFETQEGIGTTFFIRIPMDRADLEGSNSEAA